MSKVAVTAELGAEQQTRLLRLVRRMVDEMERALEEKPGEFRATVGDFVRLIQLQKELEAEQVREVHVQWVGNEP
jgi:hypothetical protein